MIDYLGKPKFGLGVLLESRGGLSTFFTTGLRYLFIDIPNEHLYLQENPHTNTPKEIIPFIQVSNVIIDLSAKGIYRSELLLAKRIISIKFLSKEDWFELMEVFRHMHIDGSPKPVFTAYERYLELTLDLLQPREDLQRLLRLGEPGLGWLVARAEEGGRYEATETESEIGEGNINILGFNGA
jgi:hypothetical protein